MNPFEEAVAFLIVLAAAVYTLRALWRLTTKHGTATIQQANTDSIVEQAHFTCPIHGPYAYYQAVVASNPCPKCFAAQQLTRKTP